MGRPRKSKTLSFNNILFVLFIFFGIIVTLVIANKLKGARDIGKPKADALPAFPGAQGFGYATIGGRGGRVIEVNNLNASGSGSFKEALEAQGPRIVVFKVGGVIRLSDMPVIRNPYLTIAGQTAPGNGIVLRGAGITIATHDVIVRGLKIRPGDDYPAGEETRTRDCINISNSSGGQDIYNIVIDHNSLSWGLDECASVHNDEGRKAVRDITFSWNIISESLQYSIHVDEGHTWPDVGPHGTALIVNSKEVTRNGRPVPNVPEKVSVHHNLLAHNDDRNPRFLTSKSEFVNNLVYNWGSGPTNLTMETGEASYLHVYGNHYISANDTRNSEPKRRPIWVGNDLVSGSKVYIDDNIGPNNSGGSGNDAWQNVWCEGSSCFRVNNKNDAFIPSNITVQRSREIYDLVYRYAGANTQTDRIDDQVRQDLNSRTGTIKDCVVHCDLTTRYYPDRTARRTRYNYSVYTTTTRPNSYDSDHDGMPNTWEDAPERSQHLDPNNASDASRLAPSGYTWVEEYINSLINMPASLVPSATPRPTATPTVRPTNTPTPRPTTAPTSSLTTINKRVFKSSDDVEQLESNGRMDLSSVDLDLFNTTQGDVIVGLRFGNITIPRGKRVVSAYLEFTPSGNSSEPTSITIFGHDTDNAPNFADSNWNLSSDVRPKTDSSISWQNVISFTSANQIIRSPNIAAVIQEIVNRGGWRSGNAMAFILRGDGKRVVKSFDGNSQLAPKLIITY